MAFDQGGSVQPGVVNDWRFTLSPDSVFPPYRSLQGSFGTDSRRSLSSVSLTPSDAIERRDYCRAYSIGFCFPPDYSEAGSASALSSPAVWDEDLRPDTVDEDSAVVGEDNDLPVLQSTIMSSLGGRASSNSIQKVVDTLGSRLTKLKTQNKFFSSFSYSSLPSEATRAVTVTATLLKALSEENLKFLEMEIFSSVGVRTLISNYKEELLTIYASNKREELDLLSRKVVKLGNRCDDPQWHLLNIYFSRLQSSNSQYNMPKGGAELEKDYFQKLYKAEAFNLSGNLQKESLSSMDLEQIVAFLVDAVTCIHQLLVKVSGNKASSGTGGNFKEGSESLGVCGLALRYANIVLQIDSSASDLSKARDSLYDALPENVKQALRSRLQNHGAEEEHLSPSVIKAEMDKTLEWLVPLATNTYTLERFGWFGESPVTSLTRFQTLFHAKKHKMDSCILELVTLLNRLLISSSRNQDGTRKIWPWQSNSKTILDNHPISKTQLSPSVNHDDNDPKPGNTNLSTENRLLSEQQTTVRNKSSPVEPSVSDWLKSYNRKEGKRFWGLSRSMGSSAGQSRSGRMASRSGRMAHERQTASILDAMDGLNIVSSSS